MSDHHAGPDPCGIEDLAAKRPDNRPGLSAISYRIGTHSAFLRRMLWNIPRQVVHDPVSKADWRPLAPLTARSTADPSIALMDAFAATLDVLSFYSERIANEGYIGTATERASVLELARSIGYEFAPGVAASVHLAFIVEDSDDPFRSVEVPAGTQCMSVPQAKGALPQTYETAEAITARAEWNAIPARTEEPQSIALYRSDDPEDERNGRLYLFDLDNSFDLDALDPADVTVIDNEAALEPYHPLTDTLDLAKALADLQEDAQANDQIDPTLKAIELTETFLRGTGLGLSAGDRMLAVGARRDAAGAQQATAAGFRVVEAEADREFAMTRLVLAPIGKEAKPGRRRLPKLRMAKRRIGAVTTAKVAFNAGTVDRVVRRTAWRGSTFSAFLKTQRWPRLQLMRLVRQPPQLVASALGEAEPGFYALRQTLGFFGNAATRWETLAKADDTKGGTAKDPYKASWDDPNPRTIWTDSQGIGHPEADAYLEREIDEIAVGQWVLIESPAGNVLPLRVAAAAGGSRADFANNGKATGLAFRRMDGTDLEVTPASLADDLKPYTFRTARAHVVSERLAQAGAPIKEDLPVGAPELALGQLYLDLEPGRSLSISGERADAPGVSESETLAIDEVLHIGGATRVIFAGGPAYAYRRASIRVNANLVLATHGEAHAEAIGSGDAAVANQAFRLAKTPLTFVSAATPTGIASTLTVRVDGLAWREVAALLDAGPEDRVYQLRIDDDGTTRVTFGDGVHGRRLPTGALNVTASYRAGIGAPGETPDETITQLKTRPLGIRSVVNPSPATGSAEPETLARARERAPQSTRTLGRIVSLTDYADFARGFAGIGKAAVVPLWVGRERIAHLTVAPAAESVFDEASKTLADLRAAVAGFRNETHRVTVAPHAPRFFHLAARLVHDPAYLPETVEAAARTVLEERFGYAARSLAQPVSAAEVVAALQGVPGVAAVDLDALALYDESAAEAPAGLANILPAAPARVERSADGALTVLPAELLTLLTAGASLTLEADHA